MTGSQDEPDRSLFITEGMAFDSIALQWVSHAEAGVGRQIGNQQDGAAFIVAMSKAIDNFRSRSTAQIILRSKIVTNGNGSNNSRREWFIIQMIAGETFPLVIMCLRQIMFPLRSNALPSLRASLTSCLLSGQKTLSPIKIYEEPLYSALLGCAFQKSRSLRFFSIVDCANGFGCLLAKHRLQ